MILKKVALIFTLFITLTLTMFPAHSTFFSLEKTTETRQWLNQSAKFNIDKILNNISPKDGLPGSVIAATTRSNPNYYYHWVRDAALATNALLDTYPLLKDKEQKQLIRKTLFDYLDFCTLIQNTETLTSLGEPKFNINGTAYNEPWGRPQNDSPALRAISLIHFANILIANGEEKIVNDRMYNSNMPATSPIKKDLEYVSLHWKDPSFDLWEEVKGTHFYSLMVERKAMIMGAALANQMHDTGAADWYLSQSKAIELELKKFWDIDKGYIVATVDRKDGLDYKQSNLDIAVILGLLHGDVNDGFLPWDDPRVTSTLHSIIHVFSTLYPINQHPNISGYAIGRYPEDRYTGGDFEGGNPWPLCTLAVAEALYRYANVLIIKGNTIQANEVANYADQFVNRVRYHANQDGSLNEQIDKNTGFMTSASNLTWNYAAMLSTRHSLIL